MEGVVVVLPLIRPVVAVWCRALSCSGPGRVRSFETLYEVLLDQLDRLGSEMRRFNGSAVSVEKHSAKA